MIHLTTTKKSRGINTKEFIVLHHTASTASTKNVANYLAKNPAQLSAHYVVGQDGEVIKIGNDNDILWHAGKSKWKGKRGLNKYSIGIEINSDGKTFSEPQRAAVRALTLDLMAKYHIPKENVIRHKDIAPNRKWDVGDNFWNEYKTFKDYQNSLNTKAMLINETIMLLKSLWPSASDDDKVKIGDLAKKLRKVQDVLGEDITK